MNAASRESDKERLKASKVGQSTWLHRKLPRPRRLWSRRMDPGGSNPLRRPSWYEFHRPHPVPACVSQKGAGGVIGGGGQNSHGLLPAVVIEGGIPVSVSASLSTWKQRSRNCLRRLDSNPRGSPRASGTNCPLCGGTSREADPRCAGRGALPDRFLGFGWVVHCFVGCSRAGLVEAEVGAVPTGGLHPSLLRFLEAAVGSVVAYAVVVQVGGFGDLEGGVNVLSGDRGGDDPGVPQFGLLM